MGAYDGEEVVVLQEFARGRVAIEVGAASHTVMREVFRCLFVAEVFQRITPQQVTHRPKCRGLLEPIQLKRRLSSKAFYHKYKRRDYVRFSRSQINLLNSPGVITVITDKQLLTPSRYYRKLYNYDNWRLGHPFFHFIIRFSSTGWDSKKSLRFFSARIHSILI